MLISIGIAIVCAHMHANTKTQLGSSYGFHSKSSTREVEVCRFYHSRYLRRAGRRKFTCTSFAWFYYCSRTLPYRRPPPFALLNSRPASTPAAAQIMALLVISAPECCTPNASARERRVAWLIQGGSVLSIQKKTSQLTTRPHADMITSRAFPAIVASLPALGASSGLAFVLLSAARCRWIRRACAFRPTSGNVLGRSRHLRRRNWARRARSRSTIASTASAAPARCSTGASPSCSSLAPRSSRPLAPCTERKSPVSGPSALLSPYRLKIASLVRSDSRAISLPLSNLSLISL